jgi:hypothetical protein
MSSKPNGKKRARQADFLASFSGPRIRSSPQLTRSYRADDTLKFEERPLPVPIDTRSPTIQILEPLERETDCIDALSDGEGEGEGDEVVAADDNAKGLTQVCPLQFSYQILSKTPTRHAPFLKGLWKSRIDSKIPSCVVTLTTRKASCVGAAEEYASSGAMIAFSILPLAFTALPTPITVDVSGSNGEDRTYECLYVRVGVLGTLLLNGLDLRNGP